MDRLRILGAVTRSLSRATAGMTESQLEFEMPFYSDFVHFWTFVHAYKNIRTHGLKSALELEANCLSGFIREQVDWAAKIGDRGTVLQWVAEVEEILRNRDPEKLPKQIAQTTLAYVLKELRYYLGIREGSLEVGTVDGSWMSDSLIPEGLKSDLMFNVGILENSIPKKKRHQYSDNYPTTWSPLHPSMHAVAIETSKILKQAYFPPSDQNGGRGNLIHFHEAHAFLSERESKRLFMRPPVTAPTFRCTFYAGSFRWLPSEFEIGDNNSVRIASYINDLHPEEHSGLYDVIEGIFGAFVPLFEKVLTELQPKYLPGTRVRLNKGRPFKRPTRIPKARQIKLTGQRLQVVTQLSNIELTPEASEYTGDFFHFEGGGADRIVAVGVYYYSSDNITESRVEFRRANECCRFTKHQTIGDMVAKEGRCVVFPNLLKNRDVAFKLADPSREGHRKSILFFLVDPSARVISTAYVPPQQKAWFAKEVLKEGPVCLPAEIVEILVNKMGPPWTCSSCLDAVRKFMAKRKRDAEVAERSLINHV